jgi:hypothetical protein
MMWAYPASLRREYQRELLLTFRNRAEDVLDGASLSSTLSFALHITADWLDTLAGEREEPATVSLLGLGAQDGEACGCLDPSTLSVSLLLATLGVALLIGGWYEWLSFKAVLLSHPRTL